MANTYITQSGDQWDVIAKKVYGDEKYADFLMANNFPVLDVFEFEYGTVLNVPDLPEESTSILPSFRQEDE